MQRTTVPNLLKDPKTGALVNSDLDGFKSMQVARKRAKQVIEMARQIASLEARVTALEEIRK